jgi:hypothetical protein
MWNRDKDSGKWIDATQSMSKNVYDNYKQDQSKVRMYSKSLSGAVYFPTNDVNDIYGLSKYRNKTSWFYGTASQYATQQLPTHEAKQITPSNIGEYVSYVRDYAMTIKNLFTTDKLIGANLKNFQEVDLATTPTDSIDVIASLISGVANYDFYVDGVLVQNGPTLLIKDMTETISLPIGLDPQTYFIGNYYKINDFNSSSDDFMIYSKDNGIYTYENGKLNKSSTFDLYENAYNLAFVSKLGTNRGNQYHLSRLLNGVFPINGMPIEFVSGKNWIIRNVFDYNNIYDVILNSVIVSKSKSVTIDGVIHDIPKRIISVGEFGTIINAEYIDGLGSNRAHLVNTKFKDNLNCIVETNRSYWACGDHGTLLNINMISFEVTNNDLGIMSNLNKVVFYDNSNGVVVGDFGEIYTTTNAGLTWTKQYFESLLDNILLDVIYNRLDQMFIVGKHGLFIQMDMINGAWKPWVKQVIKTVDYYDEYLLHDDIVGIIYTDSSISLTIDNGYGVLEVIDINEYFIMGTSGGGIVVKTFNDKHEFLFIELSLGGSIRGLVYDDPTHTIYLISNTVQTLLLDNLTFEMGGNMSIIDNSLETNLDAYVNSIALDDINIYSCGSASRLYMNPKISLSTEPEMLDQNYGNYDKSKLLFLDYDIASKLAFFGDDGDYILPDSVSVPIPMLNKLTIDNLTSEHNWVSYYMDSLKKYQYYKPISDDNVVTYSTAFEEVRGIYKLDNIVKFVTLDSDIGSGNCLVSNNFVKFSELLPNAGVNAVSGFKANTPKLNRNQYGVLSNDAKDIFNGFGYCVMLYKYMMIIKMPIDLNNKIGSAFNIDSAYVNTTVLLNRIHTNGAYHYLFFETDFNDSMIQSIMDNVDTLVVTNLNVYSDITELLHNFQSHPLSIGYDLTQKGSSIVISGRFNNKTAYYNLQANVGYVNNNKVLTTEMLYNTPFAKFGYSPTYNLLNYLGNINNDVFTSTKVFTAMPIYTNIPLNGIDSSNSNNVFIDFGRVKTNYMSFGENLHFEWETIWLHTFVDIDLVYGDETMVSTKKLLVTKKYKLENRYVIEFSNTIDFIIGSTNFVKFNIKSRNTLLEISSDLQTLNNIQRSSSMKKIGSNYVTNLESELSSKFPTDSYCKVLLSDYDIKDSLSGIIYTDYANSLAFNIIKTEHNISLLVNNAYQKDNKVVFNLSNKHGAKVGDYVIVRSNGGYVNPPWLGFASIIEVIDDNTIAIEKDWGNPSETGCDAVVYYVDNDPLLNYQPVDIMDLGIDIDVKQSVELNPSNIKVSGEKVSLVNVNYSKYRYTCVDGLSISIISERFPWILNADISNAIIGYDESGLIWYSGNWNSGRWFGSKWYSGKWLSGDWYTGTWESKKATFDNISMSVSNTSDNISSKWFGGRWFGGQWDSGSWYSGRMYSVTWNGGIWNGGIWNGGTWVNGEFKGGIWVSGIWKNGIFNTNSSPAYWIGGIWGGGDFENGRWFGGEFSEKFNKSKFGTKSSNTRNSIWDSGSWLGGEFHSGLSTATNGDSIQSDIHRFSYWKTGTWGGGNFYGGTVYNISFSGGNWYGGISDDIEIVNPETLLDNDQLGSTNSGNKIRLNGVFRFNIGDEITISGDEHSNIGSGKDPLSYRVSSSYTDDVSYTELRLVSLAPVDDLFKLYLVFSKLEYISRFGLTINPSVISFMGAGTLDIYEHLKECLYGRLDGTKPILAVSDLVAINNLINNNIEDGNITINFNKMGLNLSVVSKFTNSNWHSGVWYNGVYENGNFTGGVWYNGKFNGQWG